MIEWIKSFFSTINKDVEIIKADLEAAQAVITELSGGLLNAQTELALLRLALTNAGITIPLVPPVGTDLPKQINSNFLQKVA